MMEYWNDGMVGTMDFHVGFRPCRSLSVPVGPCPSLSVPVRPCLSLSVPVIPSPWRTTLRERQPHGRFAGFHGGGFVDGKAREPENPAIGFREEQHVAASVARDFEVGENIRNLLGNAASRGRDAVAGLRRAKHEFPCGRRCRNAAGERKVEGGLPSRLLQATAMGHLQAAVADARRNAQGAEHGIR